jgi:hypothetical protein
MVAPEVTRAYHAASAKVVRHYQTAADARATSTPTAKTATEVNWQQMPLTDDWPQLRPLAKLPEQRTFELPHRVPQLPRWEPSNGVWWTVLRVPPEAARWRGAGRTLQIPRCAGENSS